MIRLQETKEGPDMRTRSDEADARRARLLKARAHAGFPSSRAAALGNGWKESTYRSHENGTRAIGEDDIHRYSAAFGVSFDWLFAGKGEMVDTPELKPLSNVGRAQREISPSVRELPVLGRAVGGSSGAIIMDGSVYDCVPCPPILSEITEAYALEVVGDSMEPRYFAGELVYVHPGRSVHRDAFVVLQVRDGNGELHGYVKQFVREADGILVCRQYNPAREIEFERDAVEAMHLIVQAGIR